MKVLDFESERLKILPDHKCVPTKVLQRVLADITSGKIARPKEIMVLVIDDVDGTDKIVPYSTIKTFSSEIGWLECWKQWALDKWRGR